MTKRTLISALFIAVTIIALIAISGCTKQVEQQKPDDNVVVPETSAKQASQPSETPVETTESVEETENLVVQEKPKPPVTCSDPAPDFSLKNINGEIITLSEFRGKVVLIDFWTTWCKPCRMGIPDLIAMQNEYGKDDFIVIGVSLDRQPASVPRFTKQMGINYQIVYGFGNSIVQDYGNITSIPATFIVNRDGCITKKLVGLHPKAELQRIIQPLIDESA